MKKALLDIAALLAATSASASIIPTLFSITPDGSNFRYTYNVSISPDTAIAAGDRFTIFDFASFVQTAASGQPADLDFSFQLTGPDHDMQNTPNDAANVFDLTWTYDGPTVINDDGTESGDDLIIGQFPAVSTFSGQARDLSSAEFTNAAGQAEAGRLGGNTQGVTVPAPVGTGQGNEVPVSEPGMLGLLSVGLLGLAAARRRKA